MACTARVKGMDDSGDALSPFRCGTRGVGLSIDTGFFLTQGMRALYG